MIRKKPKAAHKNIFLHRAILTLLKKVELPRQNEHMNSFLLVRLFKICAVHSIIDILGNDECHWPKGQLRQNRCRIMNFWRISTHLKNRSKCDERGIAI